MAITAHVDPTAKQAMRKLADFFQEVGGQFSIDSLEVILRQAVSNFCDSGAVTEEQQLVQTGLQGQYVLDVKGLSCPMPTLRSIKEIEELAPGEVLRVDSTDVSCRKVCLPGANGPVIAILAKKKRSVTGVFLSAKVELHGLWPTAVQG